MKKISFSAQSNSVTFGSTVIMINCLLCIQASKNFQIASQKQELQG